MGSQPGSEVGAGGERSPLRAASRVQGRAKRCTALGPSTARSFWLFMVRNVCATR